MPTINNHQVTAQHTNFKLDDETKSTAPNVSKKVERVSNVSFTMGGVKLGASTHSSLSISEVTGGKNAASMMINKFTAKSVLNELVKLPAAENTYVARLACLKADHTIFTWQALTRNPEELKALAQTDLPGLEVRLSEPGVWLPEVENINTNVLMSLTTKLADRYAGSFQALLLESGVAEVKDVSVVRGPPGAGKTSFLQGGFSIGSDEVKNYLQNRMPGVTMSQLYVHAQSLLGRFMDSMESKFSQSLTQDQLYLYPIHH